MSELGIKAAKCVGIVAVYGLSVVAQICVYEATAYALDKLYN